MGVASTALPRIPKCGNRFYSMLRRKGVRVVSITEHADDTPTGKLMEAITEHADDTPTGKLMEAIIESVDEFYSENLIPVIQSTLTLPSGLPA